jgi:hypothetical protein
VHTFMGYERQQADPIYYSLQEQRELNKGKYMAVPKLTFLAAVPLEEGRPATWLQEISLRPFVDFYGWPRSETVATVRSRLVARHGRPVRRVMAEIEQRRVEPAGNAGESAPRRRSGPPSI